MATAEKATDSQLMNGADILVKSLVDHDVEVIFAYPGGASMPLHQALTRYKDRITDYHVNHTSPPRPRGSVYSVSLSNLATVTVLTLTCLAIRKESWSMPIETQPLVLASYLIEAGEKLSCHFTVEYTEGSSIWARRVTPLDANVTTVTNLVKELREKLPEMEVKVNRKQKNHPVIHLIEKPLAKKKNNVLEKEVDLQYSGVVGMIAAELEKSIPEITPPRSGPSTEFGNDHVTKVRIDVKNQTIRELLTHCVPLDQYNRVIWVAKTYVYQGKSTTSVRFIGPKN